MERLIYSNAITTSNLHNPFLPRFDASKSAILSSKAACLSSTRSNFLRLTSKLRYPSSNFWTPTFTDSENLSHHGPGRFLADTFSDKKKAVATGTGTVILLSAISVLLIQPLFVSPAFATIQTAGLAVATAGSRLFRSEVTISALTGFFAGCLHTLIGHDHLAALAPLSIGHTLMESAVAGALWGCGHDVEQVIFGLMFLLVKYRLHIEVTRTWGTRVVGFTLLVIGAMGISEATAVPIPCVALENGECDASDYEGLENPTAGTNKIGFITFLTGIAHGLQPDALMMVLPALALPSCLAGAAFLGMFLVGTVITMGSYTGFIGSRSQAQKHRIPRITQKLTRASSLIAITLGLGIIISQFFGFNLY